MSEYQRLEREKTFNVEAMIGDDFVPFTITQSEADLIDRICRTGWHGWTVTPEELQTVRSLQARGAPLSASKPDSRGRVVVVLTAPVARAWE